ncbi:MAG: polysaccharide biosynthesis/export family protein [Paludibacteraceae bacterium]|nr:polysaccharide biosynthesis/export family protein [Paludibacteraceae bacterium]
MKIQKIIIVVAFIVMLVASGCSTRENIVYLQNVPQSDSSFVMQRAKNIVIRPGDKISIIVKTDIPEMANTFNLTVPYRYVGNDKNYSSGTQTAYYTVDSRGEIDFPVLGRIKVNGMTREAISDTIKFRLIRENMLRDAVVSVDYGNLTFSVIGEVNNPGRYTFDKDCITLPEALSMANDLSIYGRRDNILVTRVDPKGNLKTYRIDLRDMKKLLSSPVYYLQQNDVIYVEPNETRTRQSTASGNSALTPAFWISVASLLTTVTTTITTIVK